MYIFRIFALLNLPKFASITQIKFKIFSLMWLHWVASRVFQRIRTISCDFCKKSFIWLNIWAKGGNQNDWKFADEWYLLSPIMQQLQKYVEYSHEIKNNDKLIILHFWWYILYMLYILMIYTFIYFTENVFPKYALIFQIFQKFGSFHHFWRFPSILFD